MGVLDHNDLENILVTVNEWKLAGLPARKIASELDRMGFRRPSPTVAWQTHHVLNLIQELRKRGELAPIGQLRAQCQEAEQTPAYHFPED